MKTARVSIYDDGDKCTYDLSMSEEDILSLWNMPVLKKQQVDLPSIEGNALLSGNRLSIMFGRPDGKESIGVDFYVLKPILEKALETFRPDPLEGV
ncbi:hypothetical protein [Chromobacterium haemolyticum]|uniref:hypothetical protein n=1 Tax=Chromobacterium haemolyticum TaxID=394935 RepID=UPI00174621CF|nr:hypothetical protein [Chromobacterium haemolyticum]QOD81422.1 hypothetical protein IEZ30_16040 [Chromobacterium haemolyticum]